MVVVTLMLSVVHRFEYSNETIKAREQGRLLTHASGLRHAGQGVSSETRWILVLFLNSAAKISDPAAAFSTVDAGQVQGATSLKERGSSDVGFRTSGTRPFLQTDLCHSRRCKRRGVDLSLRRFEATPEQGGSNHAQDSLGAAPRQVLLIGIWG